MADAVRLMDVTPENIHAACDIEVGREQQASVAPVARSLAEAYVHPTVAWPRIILDGDRVVGFVMAIFDPDNEDAGLRAGIWRLNIDATTQGRGYGRFAVAAVAEEARRRGYPHLNVCWRPGDHGPERFWLGVGFRPTGREIDGEIHAELPLYAD